MDFSSQLAATVEVFESSMGLLLDSLVLTESNLRTFMFATGLSLRLDHIVR
jgi:hypothetical protein